MHTSPLTPTISKGLLPRSSTFRTAIPVIKNYRNIKKQRIFRPEKQSDIIIAS